MDQLARSAGTYISIVGRDNGYALVAFDIWRGASVARLSAWQPLGCF